MAGQPSSALAPWRNLADFRGQAEQFCHGEGDEHLVEGAYGKCLWLRRNKHEISHSYDRQDNSDKRVVPQLKCDACGGSPSGVWPGPQVPASAVRARAARLLEYRNRRIGWSEVSTQWRRTSRSPVI